MNQIITIDVSSSSPNNLGKLKYDHIPRIGEWVEIEKHGLAHIYEVLKISHSSTGNGADIYVKLLKDTHSAISDLLHSAE